MKRVSALCLALTIAVSGTAEAADLIAFRGARILPASGKPIPSGTMIVGGGKIGHRMKAPNNTGIWFI